MKRTKVLMTKDEALECLREWLREGDTVYTVLRRVTASGMTRYIDCKLIKTNDSGQPYVLHIGRHVAGALEYDYNDNENGFKVSGTGMDMGFHVVYLLSRVLYPDTIPSVDAGYKLRHERI